jgi:hypothetical protein
MLAIIVLSESTVCADQRESDRSLAKIASNRFEEFTVAAKSYDAGSAALALADAMFARGVAEVGWAKESAVGSPVEESVAGCAGDPMTAAGSAAGGAPLTNVRRSLKFEATDLKWPDFRIAGRTCVKWAI